MNKLDAFCRGFVTVRNVGDFDSADIETMLTGHGSDLSGRIDKNWNNDAVLRAIHGAAQRTLIARMYPAPITMMIAITATYGAGGPSEPMYSSD